MVRSMGACSAPSARSLPLSRSEENAVALLIGIFPIDSHHATICQINRNGQAQLKKIQALERMLKKKDKENEELRKRLSKYEEPPKNSGNSSNPPSKEQYVAPDLFASLPGISPEVSRGTMAIRLN